MDYDKEDQQLDQLVSLIASSVEDLKVERRKIGGGSAGKKNIRATAIIEAACAQLCAQVLPPEQLLLKKNIAFMDSAALHTASSVNAAGILVGSPNGMHVEQISKAANIDADTIGRILRYLATQHVFQEVQPNVFANNRNSEALALHRPIRDVIANSPRTFKAAAYLNDFIMAEHPRSAQSPFHLAFGSPLMEFHNTPEGKKTVPMFMRAVAGLGELKGKTDLLHAFPWKERLSSSEGTRTICDVGAGDGYVTLMLLRELQDDKLRAIVQDRPSFIDLGKQLWSSEYPEAYANGKVDFIPIDFFEEAPAENCDIYFMRYCLHNWSGQQCVTILNNIARAMQTKGGSTLLIQEFVLRYATANSSGTSVGQGGTEGDNAVPEPLLSNFGAASSGDYVEDLKMMILTGARERTLDEFVEIGRSAGLYFQRLWIEGGASVMEFKLV